MTNRRKEIITRTVFGIAIAVPAAWIIWQGGYWFLALVATVAGLSSWEIYNLLELKGQLPKRELGVAGCVGVVIASYFLAPELLFTLLTFSLIAIFVAQLTSKQVQGAIDVIMMTFFGIIYIGWLSAHAIMLRKLSLELMGKYGFDKVFALANIDFGTFAVYLVVATTVLADTGAYFGGMFLGRRKLAPSISPGKTIEGTLIGLSSGVLTAVIVKIIFQAGGAILHYAIFGLIISVMGLLGDLAESVMKRDVEIKDSGFLIPGHGGVLDRMDSLLFSVPVSYYLIKYYAEHYLIAV